MPQLLRPEEAAEELNLGRTAVFGLMATGQLESFKVGRPRLVPAEAIAEFIARQRRDARAGGAPCPH